MVFRANMLVVGEASDVLDDDGESGTRVGPVSGARTRLPSGGESGPAPIGGVWMLAKAGRENTGAGERTGAADFARTAGWPRVRGRGGLVAVDGSRCGKAFW